MIRYLNGYLLYPLLEKLTKRNILPKLVELRKFDSLPYDVQLEQQKEHLYELLSYCEKNIPFYKEMFLEYNFEIERVKQDISYLQKLPVLTKEIVRENFLKMQAPDKGFLHTRKTGGSTGQSVFFFYDNVGLDWTAAINLRAYEMAGKKLHHTDSHIGADLDFDKPTFKNLLIDRLKLFSQNRKRLSVRSFSEEDLKKMYQELKQNRPYLLQGHPSSLYAIADYIQRKKIKPKKLCNVFEPTGEMLTDKSVDLIEKYILCKVVNRYGNAEFGVVAHTEFGDKYNKLKVFQRAFYVEPGEQKTIIATCLTNFGFPLLRYDTGDVATVTEENDGVFISNIQGRVHDSVVVNGAAYPTHFIMDFLDHKVTGVREFQIVLTDNNPLPILNIVPLKENDNERILDSIQKKWPNGFDIQFVSFEQLKLQGWRQKFRHLTDMRERK